SVHPDAGTVARRAVEVASDKQASDIVLLDIRGVSSFADYMIIMTAATPRQINALARDMEEAIEKSGFDMHHREGSNESGWVLLDFSDIVVHIFSPAQRDFYRLERVW